MNTKDLQLLIQKNEPEGPHTSYPRNRRIVNVFYRRGYIESMGIGTQEIIRYCLLAGMKMPEFFEQAGNFVVRLWSRHHNGIDITNKNIIKLTERQKSILRILGSEKLSPNTMLAKIDPPISERTLRRELNLLKKQGYLDWEGSQGPSRRWFAIK